MPSPRGTGSALQAAPDRAREQDARPEQCQGHLPRTDPARGSRGPHLVAFPFVENPGSFGFDPQGRLYVAEANRFWLGVPDLRGANELIRDDFKAVTVADRLACIRNTRPVFPKAGSAASRIVLILLEDRDGQWRRRFPLAVFRSLQAPEDGIGFSVLADDGSVYFTCIPSVWKLRDIDGDGKADEEKEISTGYGVRVSLHRPTSTASFADRTAASISRSATAVITSPPPTARSIPDRARRHSSAANRTDRDSRSSAPGSAIRRNSSSTTSAISSPSTTPATSVTRHAWSTRSRAATRAGTCRTSRRTTTRPISTGAPSVPSNRCG